MNQRVFSPKTIFYALLLIVIDTSVLPALQLRLIQPGLGYLLILYVAFKWHWQKTVPMAFLVGCLYDLIGSQPFGVETCSLIFASLILNFAVQKIERYYLVMRLMTTFVFVMGATFLMIALNWTLGKHVPVFFESLALSFTRGLVATAFFPLFYFFSVRLYGDRSYIRQFELFG